MSGTALQYLDKAMNQLRDLGLVPETVEEAPVLTLLQRIAHYCQTRNGSCRKKDPLGRGHDQHQGEDPQAGEISSLITERRQLL